MAEKLLWPRRHLTRGCIQLADTLANLTPGLWATYPDQFELTILSALAGAAQNSVTAAAAA